MAQWKIKIEAHADDWSRIKYLICNISNSLLNADSYNDIASSMASGDGSGYSIEIESPIELKIKELRRAADELERSLLLL